MDAETKVDKCGACIWYVETKVDKCETCIWEDEDYECIIENNPCSCEDYEERHEPACAGDY